MSLKLEYESTVGKYVLPKEGARPARLMTVIDVGVQSQPPWKGKTKKPCQGVVLGFELVDDFDAEGNPVKMSTGNFPLNVTRDFQTKTLHEKSKLYGIVKALDPTGKKFKDNFNNLIGEACIVTVKLVVKGDNTYANFDSASPVPDMEGFSVAEATCAPFIFDWDAPDLATWEDLSDGMKAKCRESINYVGSKLQEIDEAFMTEEESDIPF